MLQLKDITSVHLVCASFLVGSGKYLRPVDQEQDYAFPYDQLPDEAPRKYDTWDQLLPEDNLKLRNQIPKGHTWWPVVAMKWEDMHLDFGFKDAESYMRAVTKGDEPLWAPCVYQIFDANGNHFGAILDAWPVRVTYFFR